jgi:hypothetical protein
LETIAYLAAQFKLIMKRVTLLFVALLLSLYGLAQPSVTLLTFGGYTFADKFDIIYDYGYGYGKIQDGFQWGAGLEIGMSDEAAIELIYQNMKTDAFVQGDLLRYEGSIGINYAMLGGTRYAPVNDKVAGFGSFDLGVAWSNPDESLNMESVTKFAWGGRLGLRIQTNEKVSLRLHAQLLSPVQWAGGGFYLGTGGSGVGVSTGSTVYQFSFGGSLNFKLR